MVHFFLYDYRFERVWKNPDSDLERLSRYRAVLSPDFSMYLEMAPVMQLYNTFRNRWCGAYWASKGMRVIPTVNWGDESTFDFCFEGIIQCIIGQISILIHMIMKYDGTPQMDILNRSLLLIIPMEHRNSNNMEDEKRWETFYMYQTTEA